MRPYAERKAARIARLMNRADRLRAESSSAYDTSARMADAIPFGQPILVGHHSEGRDRRYRERMRNAMDRSVALGKAANEAERRAGAAERNTAISSDDPEAVTLLRVKLDELNRAQTRNKQINTTIRTAKRRATRDGIPWEPAARAALEEMGLSSNLAAELVKPDFAGRIGIADYEQQNNGANIRRIEARIADLERRASAPAKDPEIIGAVRIEQNDNRVQIFFPDKPASDIRSELKSFGFRWAPSEGAWQRMASESAWRFARQIAGRL